MTAEVFFRRFTSLLVDNPPHKGDGAILVQLARIGIAPGKPFDTGALGPDGRKALDEGAELAKRRLDGRGPFVATGWTGMLSDIGRYGNNYSARALMARVGLGANPPEDAVYFLAHTDAAGAALAGRNRYQMHFDKSQLPPVRAFWSVTMYGEDGFFVPNPAKRYAIGDRDRLRFNEDGSLDILIQKDTPDEALNANWLPAPEGLFNLAFRLYWPEESVLTGKWKAPPVRRIEHSK